MLEEDKESSTRIYLMFKELEVLLNKLKNQKVKRIFIQIAEGLKNHYDKISEYFTKNGFETIFSLEPTYGACDIRDEEAKRLNCDAIIHIGHSNIGIKSSLPVFYVHFVFDVDKELILDILRKHRDVFFYNSYVLVSSLQYIKYLDVVKEYLENLNKKVLIKKVLEYEGQILGCNINAAKIDEAEAVLVISEGFFYPLGLVLEIENKPIIYIDLEKKEVKEISQMKEKYEKIIAWYLVKFKEAKKVGLLVSWKKGQCFFDPFEIKKKIENLGKKVYIFAFDEIRPEKLEGIDVDFLINLACPRIFPDDIERFKIPILNFFTLKKLLYEEERNRNNSF